MSLSDAERDFLDSHRVARLATADAGGVPHVVPICFVRIDDVLYFVVDEKPKRRGPKVLKRLANLADNPRAAVVVDDYDDDWSRLAYLLLHCEAGLVDAENEYERALSLLRQKYEPYRRMQLGITTHPMVALRPYRTHLWRAGAADTARPSR